MIITSIVENTSKKGLPVEHGLSIYIQLDNGQRVLFDMGQSDLFARNAEQLNLDIKMIDTAVISHGHYDHGGGLNTFLNLNTRAKIYIHQDAFLPHYSLRDSGLAYIGLDPHLQPAVETSSPVINRRYVLCGNVTRIDDHMMLFADVEGSCCWPHGNQLLFGPTREKNDSFNHEQNLIIQEGDDVILFAGCAHRGIINILRKAEQVVGKKPTHVLAGMHLVKSGLDEEAESAFIRNLAHELKDYKQTQFYTMHCTGEQQFLKLKQFMNSQIEYLSCGDMLIIGAQEE